MIIDMHAHVWRNRQEQSLRTIRRAADIYHLDKVLISGLGSYSPDQAEISLLNAAVAAICEEDPLFAGYVYVDPLHQDAMDTLQYWLPHPCMVGMKLWVSCRCDETACDSLYEYCAAEKAPVLIHAFEKAAGQLPGESTAYHVRRAALRHPETTFIMAHLGGNCYTNVPLIADLPNVLVDFSGTICRADDLPYAIELLGSARILFGSDMPGAFAASYGQLLACNCTPAEKKQIAYENAKRIFPKMTLAKDARPQHQIP